MTSKKTKQIKDEVSSKKISKIFKTSGILDILPVRFWWDEEENKDIDKADDEENNDENNDESKSVKSGSEDNDNKDGKMYFGSKNEKKFSSLEHNGVFFPSAYKPHNVKIKYLDEAIELSPEAEELATFWAQALDTDFCQNEYARKNFFKEFRSSLKRGYDNGKSNSKFDNSKLEDFDFTSIAEYLAVLKQKNKNKTSDEKRQEKEKKAKLTEMYGLAFVDKFAEKISNYMVEPPGLFRGRGDHPGTGKLKARITPEEVTINVGPDDPVPICNLPGHNWKTVINNTECTWLAMYKENKNTKYVFLAGNSKFKGKNDLRKYEKARKLKSLINTIREDYFKQMKSNDTEKQQLGVATYLIDILALRVGNEKGEDEADTVGCCSLRVEHIKLNKDDSERANFVTFKFLGKDSMEYNNTVELNQQVVKLMRKFIRAKNDKDDLFDLINAGKLNDYLKSIYPHLSAKVFRTYNASVSLQKQLDSCDLKENDSAEKKVEFYDNANRQVAILCNHQKTVSKGFNSTSELLHSQLKELLKYLEELQEHLTSFKGKIKKKKESKKKTEEEGTESKLKKVFPDNFEKTTMLIKSLEDKISKLEKKITSRDENKDIALNTSKLNYMDPRITVSWCKKIECPIEKVFPKSVREKFPWAMYIDPNYQF